MNKLFLTNTLLDNEHCCLTAIQHGCLLHVAVNCLFVYKKARAF